MFEEINVLQEFTNCNTVYGFYLVKFDGETRLLTRNGNKIAAVVHGITGDKILDIRQDVTEEFFNKLETNKC